MWIETNDLNLNKFITNCKAINHMSNFDKWEKNRNIEDNSNDNVHKFVVEYIYKQPEKEELFLTM